MRIAALLGLLFFFGCITTPPPSNNTVPPGYEVKDYCQKDGDCVRLNSCCDCGAGQYVNIYNQQPECPSGQPRCMCPIMDSVGKCENNKCVAVQRAVGFCGWSTNGSCSSDQDCMAGGCSGQVCQSKSEEPVATTCEYTDCYNADAYGVECGCSGGRCEWQ